MLTKNGEIDNLIDLTLIKTMLPLSCIIMAGGKGIRLKPYTDNTPKALLKLDGKPIIAHNIDRLILFGIKEFYVSVNHMKEKIIKYLNHNYRNEDISIKYIEETQPLGTIGSVRLHDKYNNDDILIMNCDILTNIDFEDFFLKLQRKK